ncbi:ADP-ribose glycohydrolase MACROD2-like [Ruditapes philippinarum]|uniref:ADP-ribose glycohydrolase MACROD2-like n=1 Tax=Ruditapes philippinarum TaxID=129788 RepID=UPI00295AE0B1|nr:ADP-ribose glycohydrolase MACROD2-like [Ruditapes philippinarum]
MLRIGFINSASKLLYSCNKGKVGASVISQFSIASLLTTTTFILHVKMSSALKTAEKDKNAKKSLFNNESKEKKITRSVASEAERNWKEHYLKLPLDEKRKEYSCGKKYVLLDEIESWSSYASKLKTKDRVSSSFDVDEELNMKISLWRGDITCLEIDVICNAANGSLLGGGGVDGAIHRAAGKKLYEECVKLNGCDTGSAKLTGGYKLPARYILHTVGPIGEKPDALASCYKTCLDLAKKNNLRSIAFPCISTGIYGYDVEKATPVVMETVRNWLLTEDNGKSIDKIIFCVFLIKDVSVYQENLQMYFPVEKPIEEIPEKKKSKSSDSSKNENKEQKESSEKKKAKTGDSVKNESKEEKEQKELSERKKLKIEDSENANKEKKDQKELSDIKKPKTGDSPTKDSEEVKEQNENKSEEKSVSEAVVKDADIVKKKEKEKKKSKNKSEKGKEVVQESYL